MTEVRVFFNFRSPYCYLASKRLFQVFDDFHATLVWRPLPGWAGRSDPERAKVKLPIARQDVRRFARRMGIPVVPPPVETDPTRAAAVSLYAEEQGALRTWVVETMRIEWAEGRNIGEIDALCEVARRTGLDADAVAAAADDAAYHARLETFAAEARESGVFGVPTFVIGEDIFWGNDRIEFVRDHLRELALARL